MPNLIYTVLVRLPGKTLSQLSEEMLPFCQIYLAQHDSGWERYTRRRNEIAPTAYRSTMAGISEYSQWCRPGPDGLNI